MIDLIEDLPDEVLLNGEGNVFCARTDADRPAWDREDADDDYEWAA